MGGQTAMVHITTNMSNIYYLSISFKSLQFTYLLLFIDSATKQTRSRSRQETRKKKTRRIRDQYNGTAITYCNSFGAIALQVPLQVWGPRSSSTAILRECVNGHRFKRRRAPPDKCLTAPQTTLERLNLNSVSRRTASPSTIGAASR